MLFACPHLLLLPCLASLTRRGKTPAMRLDVVRPVSSLIIPVGCSRDTEVSQVDSLSLTPAGQSGDCLSRCCSAHRHPLSCTFALVSAPVVRVCLAIYRHTRSGPRWVNGEDIPQGEHFEAQSHGFSARCQRFAPASRLTTHDSLPAAWLQALPRGVLTRWAAS